MRPQSRIINTSLKMPGRIAAHSLLAFILLSAFCHCLSSGTLRAQYVLAHDSCGNIKSLLITSGTLPVILGEPSSHVVSLHNSVGFSVLVNSSSTVAYQWRFNNVNISGATGDSLFLENVVLASEGEYTVVVTNSTGSIVSRPFRVGIDTNGNGLPDTWEVAQFGNTAQLAGNDFDGDGKSNLQEYLDGTIPVNSASAKYALNIFPVHGAVSTSPTQTLYDSGSVVTLSHAPESGYAFQGWLMDRGTASSDYFALKATAWVTIPTAGTWTFGVRTDHGARLVVDGQVLITANAGAGAADFFGQRYFDAGVYSIELVTYEVSGPEEVEVFAAAGTLTAFDNAFHLVGDTTQGGLAVTADQGALAPYGWKVQQVAAAGTTLNSLTQADNLLAGGLAKVGEAYTLEAVINYAGSGGSGRFGNDLAYPLFQANTGFLLQPWSLPLKNDRTIYAINSLPLSTVLDSGSLSWQRRGQAPWYGENATKASDGVDHARSGPLSHGQSSSLSTVVTGPGSVQFRWKVSSQADADFLQFLVDGVVQQQISGDSGWAAAFSSLTAAGSHALEWRYLKDATLSQGADAAWLDQVSYIPASTPLQVWKQTYWPANPASPDADDLANPSHDGVVNAMKYALGMNPTSNSRLGLPSVNSTISTVNFSFQRARSEVTYEVQTSNDLKQWQTYVTNPGTVGSIVTVGVPRVGNVSLFIRLRITLAQ